MTEMVVLRLGLATLAVVLILRLAHDRWQRHKLGPFAELMSPECQVWLDALARSVENEQVVVEGSVREAYDLWGTDLEAARARLALACDYVERVAVPDFTETIQVLRRLSRTVSALPPPAPLAQAAFRLLRTRGLAAFAGFVHFLGVTGKDRVRVRLWFLKRAFVTAARVFTGTAVLADRHGWAEDWYATLDDALGDMRTLQADSVVSAKLILTAFSRWQVAHLQPQPQAPAI
jgi:hypothetical protein